MPFRAKFKLDGVTHAPHCGGTRIQEAQETIARMRPHLAELGITRIANVTGLDTVGIPTVMVVRPNGRSLSVSQGKGASLDAAKASGLMEAVEQYHAEHVALPIRYASRSDLTSCGAVVDVERLPRRRTLPAQERILWVEGECLGEGSPIWVPYELVHLDFTLPLPPGSGYFLAGSNGLASGNHPLEAVVHGIYEVIERDATTLFYLEPPPRAWRRRVDPASVSDPTCVELLARFREAAVLVAIWDTTSDVGVPCYLVEIIDETPNPFRPAGLARGAGCHLDPAIALARALCEAAQSRLTRIAGTRDDIDRDETTRVQSLAHMEATRQALAQPTSALRAFPAVEGSQRHGRSLERDTRELMARLRAVGCDTVAVVDLSRDYPIHVVRVLIPGMEALIEVPGYTPGPRARAVS
jgi:YcaO-like protein with predicted kinase domain